MIEACFFNARIQLNQTTNTQIPDRPARFLSSAPIAKYRDETFPDLEVSIWSPDIPDIDRTSVRTILCLHLLLIYHHFFYSLVFINVYHVTTLKI